MKLKDRQTRSLHLHNLGNKLTIHTNGAPVDPVTSIYQKTEKGKQLELSDRDKQVNSLVRTHKLQTMGTSGYNIINNQRNLTV